MYGKSACPVLCRDRGTTEGMAEILWHRRGNLAANGENKRRPVATGGPDLLDINQFFREGCMSMIRLRMKLRRDTLGYCKKPIVTFVPRNTEKLK
jgi:hypothetical protein